MNDTDVTGPLPVLPAEEPSHGPVGWITEANRKAENDARSFAEQAPADDMAETHGPEAAAPVAGPKPLNETVGLGADPDLAFDFGTGPLEPVQASAPGQAHEAGPEDTTAMAVVPALEADVPPDSPVTDQPPPPPAPPSKSRHGQPAPLSRAWNAGVAATIAVAAVVVGIIAFNHASPSPKAPANGAGPAFVLPSPGAAAQGGVVTASSPPGLDALPSASGAASASKGASAQSSASAGVPADAPSVTVLNETTTHGLAATEATRLRAAGWTVRRVTNINAKLTQTTVYYDASQESAAKALVASVPSIKVALPRPSYVLATGGLIVVVAADAA